MIMRYIKQIENDDGWTDWIQVAKKHFIRCCDCGLVHRLEVKKEKGVFYFRVSRLEPLCIRCGESKGRSGGCGNVHGSYFKRHRFK